MATIYSELYSKDELIELSRRNNLEVDINNTAYEIAEKLLRKTK